MMPDDYPADHRVMPDDGSLDDDPVMPDEDNPADDSVIPDVVCLVLPDVDVSMTRSFRSQK